MADRLQLQPRQRALDVASGTGRLALELASRVVPGGTVDGVDAASEMVNYATRANKRRNLPVTFQTAAAQQLPFPDSTFDAVTCTLALHHIAAHQRQLAVDKMHRVFEAWRAVADRRPAGTDPPRLRARPTAISPPRHARSSPSSRRST